LFKPGLNNNSTRIPRQVDALNVPFLYNRTMRSKPTSVLVIERHPLMRESLYAAIAAEAGLNLLKPSAGAGEAFRLILAGQEEVLFLTQKPDIILLSLGNPGLEDLQALQALLTKWPGLPILALTSSEVPGQEQAALEHGAREVLSKSASRTELLQALLSISPGYSRAM
jgi:DNA-binding NarL/FixJ family response regulator